MGVHEPSKNQKVLGAMVLTGMAAAVAYSTQHHFQKWKDLSHTEPKNKQPGFGGGGSSPTPANFAPRSNQPGRQSIPIPPQSLMNRSQSLEKDSKPTRVQNKAPRPDGNLQKTQNQMSPSAQIVPENRAHLTQIPAPTPLPHGGVNQSGQFNVETNSGGSQEMKQNVQTKTVHNELPNVEVNKNVQEIAKNPPPPASQMKPALLQTSEVPINTQKEQIPAPVINREAVTGVPAINQNMIQPPTGFVESYTTQEHGKAGQQIIQNTIPVIQSMGDDDVIQQLELEYASNQKDDRPIGCDTPESVAFERPWCPSCHQIVPEDRLRYPQPPGEYRDADEVLHQYRGCPHYHELPPPPPQNFAPLPHSSGWSVGDFFRRMFGYGNSMEDHRIEEFHDNVMYERPLPPPPRELQRRYDEDMRFDGPSKHRRNRGGSPFFDPEFNRFAENAENGHDHAPYCPQHPQNRKHFKESKMRPPRGKNI